MPIKEKRKIKGYSQSELSKKIGIPLRTYKRYEATENIKRTYKHDLIETQIDALPNNIVRKNVKDESISILGAGNVGYPLGLLLNARNKVTFIEIDEEKNRKINSGVPLYESPEFSEVVKKMNATSDIKVLNYSDIVIIALPTDYDESTNRLNTSKIEHYIEYISNNNPEAIIVIKSTVPVGFTRRMANLYKNVEIIFAPEFLRESHSLYDSQYPDRMIFGVKRVNLRNKRVATVMENICNNAIKTLFMSYDEAEAVKLFSNSFLAMRIAYINELDAFANKNGLNVENIITGMCLDSRIGNFYNNPSFGYGGHCLPKDTKQLCSMLNDYPLISSILKSNENRINDIANEIMSKVKQNAVIGFYKTANKNSAAKKVSEILIENGYNIIFYEKNGAEFDSFVKKSEIIVANRLDDDIAMYSDKVFTRDVFKIN